MTLPFETTSVSVSKSQSAVKKLLIDCGFDRTMEFNDNTGKTIIIAETVNNRNVATFQFQVNIEKILELLSRKRRRTSEQELKEKAYRIAWRALHYQVKSIFDSIQLGIIDIAEGFGANLLLPTKTGTPQRMSDYIKEKLLTGKLTTKSVSDQFLIE